jgi:hypothetical protein
MVRRSVLAQCVAGVLVVSLVAASLASARETTKQILQRIEETLAEIIELVTPPPPPPPPVAVNRTRLLFPYVSNWAGFDTSIAVMNTGRDSTGAIGNAGFCRVHYFGKLANGTTVFTSEQTDSAIPIGEFFTFVISGGGTKGINGLPNFQGYIEVDCAFPYAHGYAIFSDGPLGQARAAGSVPALVLPHTRTKFVAESIGQ